MIFTGQERLPLLSKSVYAKADMRRSTGVADGQQLAMHTTDIFKYYILHS